MAKLYLSALAAIVLLVNVALQGKVTVNPKDSVTGSSSLRIGPPYTH